MGIYVNGIYIIGIRVQNIKTLTNNLRNLVYLSVFTFAFFSIY